MPQALRSGKPRQSRADSRFPLSGMSGCREHDVMLSSAIMMELPYRHRASILLCGLALVVTAGPAIAAGCACGARGEVRAPAGIDARPFRLRDGRYARFAGIEPVYSEKPEGEAAD